MVFVRRSRRTEIIILGAIVILLIWNLIYFKRIEIKLDSTSSLSKMSMGSSDRDESNAIVWSALPTPPYDKGNENIFVGPETLEQSIQREDEEKHVTTKKKREQSFPIDVITTTTEPTNTIEAPSVDYFDDINIVDSRHQKNIDLDRQRLLAKAFEDFNDIEDDFDDEGNSPQTTPEPKIKPHPLEKPKTEEPANQTTSKTKDSDEKLIPNLKICPENPPNLVGKIELDTHEESIDDIQEKLGEILYPGGYYTPSKCQARHRVAIIIPYRNRPKDLAIFIKNIHPFLIKQQLEYGVFVVEQTVGTKFNRAMLLNVGYLEAKKIKKWDCFIFHDVDLLPMDDRILYTCSKNPRHLAVAVDKFDNVLPSYNTLSGVLAVTSEQFEKMNGFSNLFWGWGCEDLDLANRLKNASYKIERYDENIARYTMLSSNPVEPNVKRLDLLREGPNNFKTIGLNSINYTVQCIDESPAYTWIFTTLRPEVPGDESDVEQLGVK